ncbi:MAG: hypothetical protein V4448_12570 [Pseudomonadota bacterium]
MKEVTLQVWQESSGKYAGRILRGGVEDGRVDGCGSKNDVECQAMEAGIEYDRLEVIDQAPLA